MSRGPPRRPLSASTELPEFVNPQPEWNQAQERYSSFRHGDRSQCGNRARSDEGANSGQLASHNGTSLQMRIGQECSQEEYVVDIRRREHDDPDSEHRKNRRVDHGRPYFKYRLGTTNMLSNVEVVRPHKITMAIGV